MFFIRRGRKDGVGPIGALTFLRAVDDLLRLKPSRDMGAAFELTANRWQAGTLVDIQGGISKAGDPLTKRCHKRAAVPLRSVKERATHRDAMSRPISSRAMRTPISPDGRVFTSIYHGHAISISRTS